jgi:hypothetical protein
MAGRTLAGAKLSLFPPSLRSRDGSIRWLTAASHGNPDKATAWETRLWKKPALAGTLLELPSDSEFLWPNQ